MSAEKSIFSQIEGDLKSSGVTVYDMLAYEKVENLSQAKK